MKGFNECPNGHYYQTNLNACPYCPKVETNYSGDLDKTVIDQGGSSDRTIVENDFDKTIIEETLISDKNTSSKRDLSKTYIKTEEMEEDEKGIQKNVFRERRKIVGWLISYSIDSLGRDFRLYEGRNTIGKGTENDIVINNDSSVSGEHAIILFRNSTFYIKDNLSTNGTKINGKELAPDTPISFEDGTNIELGDTTLLFRTSF